MMGRVGVAETSKPNYFTTLSLHLLGSAGDGACRLLNNNCTSSTPRLSERHILSLFVLT